jgi:hypothetical protein
MARQYSGIDGNLLVDDVRVARVSSWSFTATADTLETTSLGDFARNYIYSIQSFSGTATIFYYENAANQIDGSGLLTDVVRTTATPVEPTHVLELRFTGGNVANRSVKFRCALNEVEITATTGEITQANISFTVCGALTTATLG